MDLIREFFVEIEPSRSAAIVDRTSLNSDRIIRDQLYLYVRSLESKVMSIIGGTFVGETKKLKMYQSRYLRLVQNRTRNKES